MAQRKVTLRTGYADPGRATACFVARHRPSGPPASVRDTTRRLHLSAQGSRVLQAGRQLSAVNSQSGSVHVRAGCGWRTESCGTSASTLALANNMRVDARLCVLVSLAAHALCGDAETRTGIAASSPSHVGPSAASTTPAAAGSRRSLSETDEQRRVREGRATLAELARVRGPPSVPEFWNIFDRERSQRGWVRVHRDEAHGEAQGQDAGRRRLDGSSPLGKHSERSALQQEQAGRHNEVGVAGSRQVERWLW